jgi:parallel beta-helix repeat protein
VTANNVTLSRVLVAGGTIGIQAAGASGLRVENCVVSGALIGISARGVSGSAIANCTVYNADACGLSISGSAGSAVFNNVVVNAGTGIVVGGENKDLAVDHNLYVALSTGKIEGQLQRPSLPTWRDVSGGLDAHSVQLAVTFANPSKRDFHPVSTLSWEPARITTADWGTPQLAGHKAPETDMDGQPRVGPYDLGAFESPESHDRMNRIDLIVNGYQRSSSFMDYAYGCRRLFLHRDTDDSRQKKRDAKCNTTGAQIGTRQWADDSRSHADDSCRKQRDDA